VSGLIAQAKYCILITKIFNGFSADINSCINLFIACYLKDYAAVAGIGIKDCR
jgi:hypothetical protein